MFNMSIVKTIAQFVRLPAGFSAVSNIIAAYVITKSGVIDLQELSLIVLASLCLYFAGMGLNDCFDFYEDRALRSNRPLPSGKLGLSKAWIISLCLLVAGCILAFIADYKTGLTSLLLAALIILYNSKVLPDIPSALTMGLCRYSNWMLVMVLEPITIQTLFLPLPLMLYVTGVTLLSNAETGKHTHRLLHSAIAFKILSLLFMLGLVFNYSTYTIMLLLMLITVTIYIAGIYRPVWANICPDTVQAAIMKLVMGVIVIDVVLLLVFNYPVAAVGVLIMLFAGRLLGRKLYVS